MSKKILVVLGHPDNDTYCAALAESYMEGAKATGAEIRYIRISDLSFDPILHKGYKVIQELEPDLVMFQESIKWAEHVVFVYPVWWGTYPALLKALIDRAFLPGFAFHFRKHLPLFHTRLLKGRSARLIYTMDTWPWYYRLRYGNASYTAMGRTILEFSGFSPVKSTVLGSMMISDDNKRHQWLKEVNALGIQWK